MKQINLDAYIGLQKTDETIIRYIKQVIKPDIIEPDGTKRLVPVLYSGAQKWVQRQRRSYIVDLNGHTIYPLITLSRTSTKLSEQKYFNRIWTMLGYRNFIEINNRYSHKRPFNTIDNNIVHSDYIKLMIPIYLSCEYNFNIFTDTMQSMNKIIEAFLLHANLWWIIDDFAVKTSFYDMSNTIEIQTEQQRIIKTEFTMSTISKLIPKDHEIGREIQQSIPTEKIITNTDLEK